MKKNHFIILLIVLFVVAQIGLWSAQATVGKMIDQTGYLKCIPEKTSPELCKKFNLYRITFLIGAIPFIVMLVFRKKIIKG